MVVLLELIERKHHRCCGCCLREVFAAERAGPEGSTPGWELSHSPCFFFTTLCLDLAGHSLEPVSLQS